MIILALLASSLGMQPEAKGKPTTVAAACQIGRFLLARRPYSGTPVGQNAVYDDKQLVPVGQLMSVPTAAASNIFDACPALRDKLPEDRKLATDDDRRRTTGITQPNPLTIYAISAPLLTLHGNEALVATTYSCPGLCYGLYELRFKLVHHRWILADGARLRVVS